MIRYPEIRLEQEKTDFAALLHMLYSGSASGVFLYAQEGSKNLALLQSVMDDPKLWKKIMDVTPLKKWAEPGEIAQWCYFLTAVNRSCTGEDILIDNGETHLNASFVWPAS